MNKLLRSFHTLLLMIVWSGSVLAQTSPYSYTFGTAAKADFTDENQTKQLGGIDWTLVSDAKTFETGQDSYGQKFGSNNYPVTKATFSTTDIPGIIKTITVTAKAASKDGKISLSAWVNNVQYGKKESVSNEESVYKFENANLQSGKIELKFNNAATKGGFYIKNITITFETGSAKTPTTITFPESEINIEEGGEATFKAQTATLKAGATELTEHTSAITYAATGSDIFAAFNAATGAATLKKGSFGAATITAKFAGDDTYAASTASYTVNYVEKAKPATTLLFNFATKTVNIDEQFTAAATLKAEETPISGVVTYSSSNPDVAIVDKSTGAVTALSTGTSTITATFAGTINFKGSTASYVLTVVDPNALKSIFDFCNNTYGYERNVGLTKGAIISNNTPITVVNTKNGSTTATSFLTADFRNYKDAILTINAAKGYLITKITMTGNRISQLTLNDNNGFWVKQPASGEWTGWSSSVSFTNLGGDPNSVCFYTITIEYVDATTLALNESTDNASRITKNTGKTLSVRLTRTLKANVWNTFCVPFDVAVAHSPLQGATIKQIASVEDNANGAVVHFEDAPTTLQAGHAYLVRTTTAIENPTFSGVTVKDIAPTNSGSDKCQFVGTYSPLTVDASLYGSIFGINNQNKLARVKSDTAIKGMRAYFKLVDGVTAAKLNFGGELSGIDAIDNGEAAPTNNVYNLNGQYVGNSLESVKKGIYVVNGKKVLK